MTGLEDLKLLRNRIDSIDEQIMHLLKQRADESAAVGKIKKQLKIEIIDRQRESEIFKVLEKKCKEQKLDFDYVQTIWNIILNKSHDIQINGK